jgi:DHA1 family bicyclomycin/chloramphenicol resistance-like MFS transporter
MKNINVTILPYLLIIALLNSCIELEISAPSFLDIEAYFNVSSAIVGSTITYNLLGFSLASILYGPLSESYGRRRVMLIGNAVLTIGAIGCVIAPSINWLLASRFIQGIGAATSAVVVSAIVADVYSTRKSAKLYGIMNAIFTSMMAISPILGGLINNIVGWRGNYGVVAIICLISWLLLFFLLPETKHHKHAYKLTNIIKDYKLLISNRWFLSSALVPNLLYSCYVTFVAIAPFLYVQSFKLNILTYTLHQGIIVAVFAITSLLAGKLVDMLGIKHNICIGLAAIIIGAGFMLFARSPYVLTIFMSIFCIGFAITVLIVFPHSMEIFPDIKGTASSAIICLRYLICSALTGAANFIYNGTATSLTILIALTAIIASFLIIHLIRGSLKNELS